MATASFTSEFTHQFDAETGRLLRRRFMWFLGTMLGLWALGFVSLAVGWNRMIEAPVYLAVGLAIAVVDISVYGWFFWRVRRSRPDKPAVLKLTRVLLVYIGAMGLLNYVIHVPEAGELSRVVPVATINFGFAFLMAAVFLPWSPKDVLRTVGLVLAMHAVAFIAMNLKPGLNWLWLALFPAFVAPGFAVCAIKHSSRMRAYKMRFLSARYGEVSREMTDARRIHEDLFPEPRDVGDMVFRYTYQPMRQIGGDFLYFAESPGIEGRVPINLVLLDVTGHGLAAALTVNRLHGELERIYAEDPHAEPGHVLGLLNRYVHLTLAQHSIYASAVCLRIDPTTNELTYANAGHPPMFLRGVDGTIEELDSTAIVLGACRPEDFHADPQTHTFMPGDMLIAYTDGAMEARNDKGKCIGRQWLTSMIAQARCDPGDWPRRIIGELDARRHGAPEDHRGAAAHVDQFVAARRRRTRAGEDRLIQQTTDGAAQEWLRNPPMPYVNVRITPAATRDQKAQIIAEITDTLVRVLGKPPEATHVVIDEVDEQNWGFAGVPTDVYRAGKKAKADDR